MLSVNDVRISSYLTSLGENMLSQGLTDEEKVGLLDENNAPTGQVIGEWSGGTSVHGVALAFDQPTFKLWYRILWGTLVLSALGLMIWQIESLTKENTMAPTNNNGSVKEEDTVISHVPRTR